MSKEKKEVEIKKLVIDIDGKEISLTIEKARKLYDSLNELFEKEKVIERHYPWYPYRPWYWHDTTNVPYITTCGSSVSLSNTNDANTLTITA